MNLNLKIEILKVFSLELNFSSEKKLTLKKEKQDEKEPDSASAPSKPGKS